MYIPFKNTIAITATDYIQATGISPNTYDSDKRRGYITLLTRGGNGREALIDFNSIKKADRREAVIKKLGAPEKVHKTPYIKEIVKDPEAVVYYNNYRYDEGKFLPDAAKEQYTNEASILNTLKNVMTHQMAARAKNGKRKKMYEFWNESIAWISDEDTMRNYPHSLPNNPRALERKFKAYLTEGYYALIHKGYGNGNADKLEPDAKRWLVTRFASPVERVTIKQLFDEYNEIAASRGWTKLATETTIHQYLHQPEVEPMWYAMRYGELKAKEKFTRQHRTLLPTMRDSIWYSDGTKLNYYYLDDNGKIATCNIYEVIDAYSECLLGYHISKSEDFEAQYLAYRMALQFAGERPYEIRYDNQGGHKKLENGGFLQKLAHLAINTMPYNGKSKTIESAFGRFQAEFLHREWYFTGQNITTKKDESKANMEFILANKANLPTLDEVKARYKQRRDEWNNAKHFDTGRPRIEMYRESVNPKAVKVEWFDMIELFGILTDAPSTYRAGGIEIQVKKIKYAYEVLDADGQPDHDFLESNVGRKFYVKYDPNDMSVVSLYVKDHAGLRFVTLAGKYLDIHRGKQEQEEDEAAFIKQQELINKARRLKRQEAIEKMMEEEGMHPAQHGLTMPKVKGISVSNTLTDADTTTAPKKKARKKLVEVDEIGEYLKGESNVDLLDILNRY
jgi:hypothetical protein